MRSKSLSANKSTHSFSLDKHVYDELLVRAKAKGVANSLYLNQLLDAYFVNPPGSGPDFDVLVADLKEERRRVEILANELRKARGERDQIKLERALGDPEVGLTTISTNVGGEEKTKAVPPWADRPLTPQQRWDWGQTLYRRLIEEGRWGGQPFAEMQKPIQIWNWFADPAWIRRQAHFEFWWAKLEQGELETQREPNDFQEALERYRADHIFIENRYSKGVLEMPDVFNGIDYHQLWNYTLIVGLHCTAPAAAIVAILEHFKQLASSIRKNGHGIGAFRAISFLGEPTRLGLTDAYQKLRESVIDAAQDRQTLEKYRLWIPTSLAPLSKSEMDILRGQLRAQKGAGTSVVEAPNDREQLDQILGELRL